MVLKLVRTICFFPKLIDARFPTFLSKRFIKEDILESLFKRIKIFLENFLLSHQLEQSKFRNNQNSQ